MLRAGGVRAAGASMTSAEIKFESRQKIYVLSRLLSFHVVTERPVDWTRRLCEKECLKILRAPEAELTRALKVLKVRPHDP